jgi:hypothetical protein
MLAERLDTYLLPTERGKGKEPPAPAEAPEPAMQEAA